MRDAWVQRRNTSGMRGARKAALRRRASRSNLPHQLPAPGDAPIFQGDVLLIETQACVGAGLRCVARGVADLRERGVPGGAAFLTRHLIDALAVFFTARGGVRLETLDLLLEQK